MQDDMIKNIGDKIKNIKSNRLSENVRDEFKNTFNKVLDSFAEDVERGGFGFGFLTLEKGMDGERKFQLRHMGGDFSNPKVDLMDIAADIATWVDMRDDPDFCFTRCALIKSNGEVVYSNMPDDVKITHNDKGTVFVNLQGNGEFDYVIRPSEKSRAFFGGATIEEFEKNVKEMVDKKYYHTPEWLGVDK